MQTRQGRRPSRLPRQLPPATDPAAPAAAGDQHQREAWGPSRGGVKSARALTPCEWSGAHPLPSTPHPRRAPRRWSDTIDHPALLTLTCALVCAEQVQRLAASSKPSHHHGALLSCKCNLKRYDRSAGIRLESDAPGPHPNRANDSVSPFIPPHVQRRALALDEAHQHGRSQHADVECRDLPCRRVSSSIHSRAPSQCPRPQLQQQQ